MDPSPSFSNVPLTQPIVISHYISMVIAFLGCYPLLLTQQIRRHKRVITFLSVLFTLTGFISGQFIKTANNFVSVVWRFLFLFLIFLVLNQFVLAVYRYAVTEKQTFVYSFYPRWFSKMPLWIDIALGWLILIIATTYLVIASQVFTESCLDHNTQGQCLLPVAMGTGFLLYGTLALLHLLSIIKIPRPSTPEYYEGLILVFWGLISLIMARTPILGSEWRAINLGLLWFTGGLFSVSLSLQTWMPALRERNIVNSIVIFLTGRVIAISTTDKDNYTSTVHTLLGNVLAFGALARIIQIIFRKSPVDNLPRRMFQNINDSNFADEDDEDEITTVAQQKCKHRALFASITLISGLSASILSIGGGFLFIGANVGWIQHMKYYIPDPTTYVNAVLSVSFLWCVYVFGICTLYIHLRRQNNILHQYQELETTTDVNVSPRVTTTTLTADRNRWSSIPLNAISTNEIMAPSPTEISTPLLHQEAPTSPIPLHDITTKTTASTVTKDDNSYDTSTDNINNNENSSKTIEKSMRPSEYRAKRRSLLVQAPLTNPQVPDPYTYHTRPRPSSGLSVGGILPDETIPTETSSFRRSWRSSSGSSVAYSLDSSAPSSPPVDRRFTSQRPTHNTLDEDLHRFDEQVVYIDQHFKSDMSKRKG